MNPSFREKISRCQLSPIESALPKVSAGHFLPGVAGSAFRFPDGESCKNPGANAPGFLHGDPYGNRTHVTAVKGRCLNRLTNGPGSGNLIRTDDIPGMNRLLYQLSYAAMWSMQFRHRRNSFCIISDTPRFVKTFFALFEKFSRGRLRPTDS